MRRWRRWWIRAVEVRVSEFGELTDADRQNLAAWMNRLPFVKWDRIIPPGSGDYITAYGWIDREDDRSDFVILEFGATFNAPGFTTSSALYSAKINWLLYGDESEHNECERIEDVAPDVANAIKLVPA